MTLVEGNQAPDFTGIDQNNQSFTLSSLKGKKVVLYFYPKDNTPGCTTQSCDLRDNYKLLQEQGFEVIGISADSVKSHQNFITKYNLPFTLIADVDKNIIESYGVWQEKNTFGKTYMGIVRTTFVINEEGVISEIITKVKTKEHSSQIIK